MKIEAIHSALKVQGQAIHTLGNGLTRDQARWKPGPDSWSILEVLNHLVDEEVYDFRAHVDHILYHPDQAWPEIDPHGWVTQRHYNEQDLHETLIRFESERQSSLIWLAGLPAINWDAAITLKWGTLSVGDLLVSWVAHDLLHLRQLVELRYQITATASHPHQVEYAGQW